MCGGYKVTLKNYIYNNSKRFVKNLGVPFLYYG